MRYIQNLESPCSLEAHFLSHLICMCENANYTIEISVSSSRQTKESLKLAGDLKEESLAGAE